MARVVAEGVIAHGRADALRDCATIVCRCSAENDDQSVFDPTNMVVGPQHVADDLSDRTEGRPSQRPDYRRILDSIDVRNQHCHRMRGGRRGDRRLGSDDELFR